jgi:serine/threonine protein phosphatase PrpC
LDVAVGAEQGKNRGRGEESYLADQLSTTISFFGVADGFGQVSKGVASAPLALALVRDYLRRKARLGALTGRNGTVSLLRQTAVAGLGFANNCLFSRSGSNEDYVAGGISIATVLIVDRNAYIAHVGDARVYLMRNGALELLTVDDAVGIESVISAATTMVAGPPTRSLLWRTLGTQPKLEASVAHVELHPSDRLLLCTSGLHRMVSYDEIGEAMAGQDTAANALGSLLVATLLHESTDGAAAIVAYDPLVPLREGVHASPELPSRSTALIAVFAIALAVALLYVIRGLHFVH